MCCFLFLIIRRPPISTRTDTLCPCTTLFRSYLAGLVGSSNNPVSGITIATILFASVVLIVLLGRDSPIGAVAAIMIGAVVRSEEHTSELQSLMRISYAVFCLKKKKRSHR